MANPISYGDPYALESDEIERRRAYAKAMQDQSLQPIEQQTAGGWVVPMSWTQGLAKMGQSYFGAQGQKKADAEARALADKRDNEYNGEVSRFAELLGGKAANSDVMQSNQSLDSFDPTAATVGDRKAALAMALSAKNPMLKQIGMAELMKTPESQFAKLDPSKYTPESLRQFAASGGKDFGVLQAREKVIADNVGGSLRYRSEYGTKPLGEVNRTNSPDAELNNAYQVWAHNNPSAAQNFDMALNGQKHQFETGQQPPAVPATGTFVPPRPGATPTAQPMRPGVPAPGTGMRAPGVGQVPREDARALLQGEHVAESNKLAQAIARGDKAEIDRATANIQSLERELGMKPSGAPQGASQGGVNPNGLSGAAQAPGLTPKAAAGLAADAAKQKQEMEQKRDFNMNGLGSTIDAARGILTGKVKPTNSYIGAGVDAVGQLFGESPKGAAQADQLKAISGVLTMKMPRMEGPQSDKDVALYRDMAGQIGDNTMPISRRLAALQQVEELWRKYDKSSPSAQQGGASANWGAPSNQASGQVRVVNW